MLGILLAAVWLMNGIYAKVLGRVPRHQAIVARFFGENHSRLLTRLIGIGEIGMALWILSGWERPWCFAAQAVILVSMNTLELMRARDLLLSPIGMPIANFGLLVLAWYWSHGTP